MIFKRPKIALALGGGAARGFAHIGILKVFEKAGIPVDLITGSSIGAFVGAGYSLWRDAALLEKRFKDFVQSEDFKRSRYEYLKRGEGEEYGIFKNLRLLIKRGIFLGYAVTKSSFVSQENYERSILSLFKDAAIEELNIRFAAVAMDLFTGKEVIITKGPLQRAIWASSAIPGFLPPLRVNDYMLIDGGWIDKIPVLPAYLLGADIVIGVDISAELSDTKDFLTGYEIMIKARAAADSFFKVHQSQFADLIIRPRVSQIHWADFSKADAAIKEGENAARDALPRIARLQRRGSLMQFVSRRKKRKWLSHYLQGIAATGSIEII